MASHVQWIANKLKEALGAADGHLADAAVKDASTNVTAFVGADGPLKIMFFFQLPEAETDSGEFITTGSKPKLFFTTGERERVRGRCFFFVRMNNAKALDIKNIETDITYGEVPPNILESFQVTLSQVFTPAIGTQDWGKSTEEERTEFHTQLEKFNQTLNDAAMSLQGGIELRKPDKLGEVENKQAAYMRAAIDENTLAHCESVVEEWCSQTEGLLAESEENRREPEDAGPDTELIFWRNRMAKFNSVAEQLKSKESKFVLGVVTTAKSKVCNSNLNNSRNPKPSSLIPGKSQPRNLKAERFLFGANSWTLVPEMGETFEAKNLTALCGERRFSSAGSLSTTQSRTR
jgi:dynein heavy chain